MQKKVFEGLILGAVLLAAIIAFWIIIDESAVGRAPQLPKSPPSFWEEPVVPWETPSPSEEPSQSPYPWESTPSPSEEPSPSPSPWVPPWESTPTPTEESTPSQSPSPSEEPSPTPTYDLDDFCDRAKRILESYFKPKRKSVYTRCTGSYDRDTGEFSGTLEFTFMFPN